MTTFTEADVEQAASVKVADLGWQVAHRPDIAPDTPGTERDDYGQVVFERRLRDTLAGLNPNLPISALDDAYRKLTRPEGFVSGPLPVTSYLVRYRQIGTSSWQNVTVDECCGKTITGLTNRRHYEVQAAAVNRLGTGPWAGPVNVTPQAPYSAPPAPTGDADLSLGTLALHWTTTGSGNDLGDSCTGPKSFYIIWDGPDGNEKRADEWAAHINTNGGAGEVTYNFRESPGSTGYYEMYGTVNFQGPGKLSINVRGRFGPTWGTWSRTGNLYYFE